MRPHFGGSLVEAHGDDYHSGGCNFSRTVTGVARMLSAVCGVPAADSEGPARVGSCWYRYVRAEGHEIERDTRDVDILLNQRARTEVTIRNVFINSKDPS